jgi:Leucine-rich repeat (LRR) protein
MDAAMSHLSLSPNGEPQQHDQHIPNDDECPSYLDTLTLRRHNLENPGDLVHYLYSYATMSELLVELDLSRNGLSDLPWEVKDLGNLRHLNLACNRFLELPSVLYTLTDLHHLDVTENQLTHLDKLPLALPHLRSLRASGNRLQRLDDRMDVWTSMTYLQLGSECGGNRLTDIPGSLARMIRLEELDLSNNQLDDRQLLSLPPALKHLKLSGNQLKDIPHDLLLCCPVLETLDMSSNQIAFLSCMVGAVYGTPLLQRLDLSNNNLTIVPTTFLESCTHVILMGNPALEYHRQSTTSYAQRLRELSSIAIYTSPVTLVDVSLDQLLNAPDHHAKGATIMNNTIKPADDDQRRIFFTIDGESWIPSLRELALRSARPLKYKPTGMPCTVLDDLQVAKCSCVVCGDSCVNEWLSAIQVKAYQTYASVVCKAALCSTPCWLVHHQRTSASL